MRRGIQRHCQSLTSIRNPLAHPNRGEERVLKAEDWAEIRRLHRAEGQPIKVVARVMGSVRTQ